MTDVLSENVAQDVLLPQPAEAQRAYQEVEREILALPAAEVRRLTVDIPHAAALALGALSRMELLRDEWSRRLPQHPLDCLDKLKTYAFASYYAHLMSVPSPASESEKTALINEGRPLRERMLKSAEALVAAGALPKNAVSSIRSGRGNVDLAGDLVALGGLFTNAWHRIEHMTPVSADDVERAGTLGAELFIALSAVHKVPVADMSPAELRARAFTLLWRVYEDCRQAVAYLRYREGDADVVAPSLFTRAARSSRPKVTTASAEVVA